MGIRLLYSGSAYDRDICWIRQRGESLRATCAAGFTPSAEGSLDGDRITLRWWAGPATAIFQGTWDEAVTIGGAFTGGLAGTSVTGEIPAILHKVLPKTGLQDRPGTAMMHAVLDDLRGGSLTEGRYEPMANKRLQAAFSWVGQRSRRSD